MAASTVTGEVGELRLGQDMIHYREVGEGPMLLFAHGILANGTLLRDLRKIPVRRTGSSRKRARGADGPGRLAELIAGFLRERVHTGARAGVA